MVDKKGDPTAALVVVVKALEQLNDADRQWVLQSAVSRWNLVPPGLAIGTAGGANAVVGQGVVPVAATGPDTQAAIARKDARAFMRIKRPSTDVQRVACLGYFLVQTTGQQGFASKDIVKAHTDSGGSSMNMTRALDNATRRAKYLSNRGPKEKQLTTLGEDIVMALPDQQAVKDAEGGAKSRGEKRVKKGRKKKG